MGGNHGLRGKLSKFGHLVAGLVIALKGFSKIEHHRNGVGAILIAIGIIFVLFTVFHEKLPWIKRHETVLLWIEAAALGFVAYSYFYRGQNRLAGRLCALRGSLRNCRIFPLSSSESETSLK